MEGLYQNQSACSCSLCSPQQAVRKEERAPKRHWWQLARKSKRGKTTRSRKTRKGNPPAAPIANRLSKATNSAYRYIYNQRQMTPEMLSASPVKSMIKALYNELALAVDQQITDNVPPALSKQLHDDVQIFSGFKAYHHLREVTAMLRNEDRSYKPWEQFRKEAEAVNSKYNRNWLRAEYQMAVGAAQMADKWAAYQKEGDQYDLLYLTAGDTAVREEHALLDQTCLPPSDPAWATLYPPNGWGCRCNVIQVLAGSQPHSDSQKAIDTMEQITPGKQAIFRFNPALAGRIFPPKHPYYGKNGYEHCRVDRLAKEQPLECRIFNELTKEIEAYPYDKDGFATLPTAKGVVRVQKGIQKNERDKNVRTAKYLAEKHGEEIDVVAPSGKGRSADSLNKTTGRYIEYKHIESNSRSAFDDAVKKGSRQADDVIIVIKGEYSKGDLIRAISNRINSRPNLQSIRVIHNYETDVLITREEMISGEIPL